MNSHDHYISFINTDTLTPCQQLLAVLPPDKYKLLPVQYQHLVTNKTSVISDYYPTNIKLDMIHKQMYWMCIPMLPSVNPQRIKNATKNIKLKKQDQIRNKFGDKVIY